MEQLELSAPSILALFETSKSERASFVTDIVQQLKDGTADPLKTQLQIKAMEDIIFQLTSLDEKKNKSVEQAKEYRDMLLTEVQKHGKSFELYNAKFEQAELGTKYNYAVCNDPLLADLEAQAKEAADKLKERQEFLKKIPLQGVEVRHEDELVQVFPPSKHSVSGVKVSLK